MVRSWKSLFENVTVPVKAVVNKAERRTATTAMATDVFMSAGTSKLVTDSLLAVIYITGQTSLCAFDWVRTVNMINCTLRFPLKNKKMLINLNVRSLIT